MPPPTPPPATPAPGPAPAKWILIVDDELAIREMIETVLHSRNWAVKAAGGAAAALAAVSAAATPPSLLICDILMPGVDGLQLTRRLLARLPGLKVILISGHLRDLSWWPTDLRESCFLAKPFTPEQLIAAVTEVIADSDAAR